MRSVVVAVPVPQAASDALEALKRKSANDVTGIDLRASLVAAGASGPEYDDVNETFSQKWMQLVDSADKFCKASGDDLLEASRPLARFLFPLEIHNKKAYRTARDGISKNIENCYAGVYGFQTALAVRREVMAKVDSTLLTLRRQASRAAALEGVLP